MRIYQNSKYQLSIHVYFIMAFMPFIYLVRIRMINVPIPISLLTFIYIIGITLVILAKSLHTGYLKVLGNLKLVYIYLLFLSGALLLTSFNSLDLLNSSINIILSVSSLFILFTVLYITQYMYIHKTKWRIIFEHIVFMFLLFIIIGQVLIDEWSWGIVGLRLSGGTNPNTISFFSLYILFQTHINVLMENKWSKLQIIVCIMSILVIIWSFSRTSITILFFVYFIYLTRTHFIAFIKQKSYKLRNLIKALFCITVIGIIGYIIQSIIFKDNIILAIKERLFNVENIYSRSQTWKIMFDYFKKSPLIGGVGWWESKEVLSENTIHKIASSSHNLYIRLLSETGIIGTIFILLLPITILFLLIKYNKNSKNPITTYLYAINFGFLIGQLFEDRYLVSLFNLSDIIIIWFLSFSILFINNAKSLKQFETKSESTQRAHLIHQLFDMKR